MSRPHWTDDELPALKADLEFATAYFDLCSKHRRIIHRYGGDIEDHVGRLDERQGGTELLAFRPANLLETLRRDLKHAEKAIQHHEAESEDQSDG